MGVRNRAAVALIMAMGILFVLSGAAFAGPSDIQGHWAEKQISDWVDRGLCSGYPDGTFKPGNSISRAEFITMVNKSFGYTVGAGVSYSDVTAADWFYGEVGKAVAAGYISGYEDNTIRPGQEIQRQEVALILMRLLALEADGDSALKGFHDSGSIPGWSGPAVAAVVESSLMNGYPDGTFKPQDSITRAEALVSLERAMAYKPPVVETGSGVTGIVTKNGSPVKDATVNIFKQGEYELLQEAVTDENGSYAFEVPSGSYDLTATTKEEVAFISNIEVKETGQSTGDMELKPGAAVSGVLLDAGGKKVADAKVLFTTNPTFYGFTDNNGKYLILVARNQVYTIRAYNPADPSGSPREIAGGILVGNADRQTLADLKAWYTTSAQKSSGGGGGGGGGGGDKTPPKINAASLVVAGETLEYTVSSDGLSLSADLSGLPGTSKISSGTMDVTENSTIALSMSIEVEGITIPINLTQELTAGSNSVSIFEYFNIFGEDGVDLNTIKGFLGSSITLAGTLTDTSGNKSNVSMKLLLP